MFLSEFYSTQETQLTGKATRLSTENTRLLSNCTRKALGSIVSLRTIDGLHFCGGVLFTKRHVLVPAICVINLYGLDYKDIHICLGIVFNINNVLSRRIGDLNVDRRGNIKVAVIIVSEFTHNTRS